MSNLYPRLADCRTTDVKRVLEYMLGEVQSCDEGISTDDRKVFVSIALMLDDELRFRDRRRKPRVPRPPTPKRGTTK